MGIGHKAPRALFTPRSELRASRTRGFTYTALLAAIVIIGISLGAAGKYWSSVMLREKEEELLFRGDQYRMAIGRYYREKIPNVYPPNIEELLKDSRTVSGKRHLRQQYKDPITGEDFEIITAQTMTAGVVLPAQVGKAGIIGVCSKSEKEPLKQANFPEQYRDFEGKKRYGDWRFVYAPLQGQPVIPGQQLPLSPPGPLRLPR
jgi:type II secretory pathway pseudopilin PulG